MKLTKLFLASLFLLGAAATTFAGPGPQYWTAQKTSSAQQAPTAQCDHCSSCSMHAKG